jgi:putative two-component system response regulator
MRTLDIDALLLGAPAPEIVAGALKHEEPASCTVHSGALLRIKESAAAIEARCARLERALEKRNRELRQAREDMTAARLDTIDRLVAAAESKDHETAAHIERIGLYSEVIAQALELPSDQVSSIRATAPMHDVGKLGIPDDILKKTTPLSADEWDVMKQHTVIGARMLRGSPSPLLQTGASIALAHHERWDGAGYPYGISREEIPLEARICSVADVFDALSSTRRYREALPTATVLDMMASQRGKHFDPRVLDAFLGCQSDIEAIHARA